MTVCSKTDVGKVRDMNQDFVKIHKFDDETALLIVCDGMGGASAGNIASEIAVNSIYESIIKRYDRDKSDNDIKTMMTSAVNGANLDVFDTAQSNDGYSGMGTTVVAVLIKDGYSYTIHAGDSRAYLAYPDGIKQITTDHSIVQHLIESKMITPEEAKHHPKRNVITRALGVDECLETDFTINKLEKDYSILVCTDGLTNFVDNDTINSVLTDNPCEQAAQKLIDLANENGGGDNITVAIAKDFE